MWQPARLKSKSHEAFQSLTVTTCGQPCVGFVGVQPSDEATRYSPLAWRSTDRMFTLGHSKGHRFGFTSPRIDKIVFSVVMDSLSQSEDDGCFYVALFSSLEQTQTQ